MILTFLTRCYTRHRDLPQQTGLPSQTNWMQIEDLYLVSYPSALCTKWMLKKFIFTPFSTFEIVIDFYFEIMNIIFSVYKRNGVIVSRSCTKRKLQSTYICSVFFIIYIRLFCRVLADSFLAPLQDAVDDWKKTSSILEKDHAKGISHHCSSLFSFENVNSWKGCLPLLFLYKCHSSIWMWKS